MADENDVGIENELKGVEKELETIKAEAEKNSKQQVRLSKYVEELKKYLAEAKQIGPAYEKMFAELSELQKASNKKVLDDDEVKDAQNKIDLVKSRYEEVYASPQNQIKNLKERQKELIGQLNQDKANVEKFQKEYEELKQKVVDPTFKIVRDQKSMMEREQQQEKKLAARYMQGKMQEGLELMKLKDPVDFIRDLEGAAKKLADATQKVRSKNAELEKISAELEGAVKQGTKCEEDIIAELRKLKPQPTAKTGQQSNRPSSARQPSQSATAS